MAEIYVDDEDEGLSPETSHPRFVELAPESFFDEADEFGPFGNDDGNDTLRTMEEWYEDREPGTDPVEFLAELLEEWDLEVPEDALELDEAAVGELVAEEPELERSLLAVARAAVAAALGQVKVAGEVSPELLEEGRKGVRLLRHLAEVDPQSPHREAALRGADEIARVLEAL